MTGTDGNLVVLVRGELFARYPGTIVYLTRSTTPQERRQRARAAAVPRRARAGHDVRRLRPGGHGAHRRDAGSSSSSSSRPSPASASTRRPTTGRDLAAIDSWDDLSWGDVVADDAALAALVHVPLDGRLAGHRAGAIQWATNSGHMAAITLQRSFRIALPLTDLVTLP